MLVKLHANAVTTPRIRACIQSSDAGIAELARTFRISESTVRRWRGRHDTADRSSRPHRLASSLSPEEEAIAVELRTRLALSLDDALEVMHRCLRPDISRSALHRCLRRHGLNSRPHPETPKPAPFAPEPFGFIHADLKHLTRLERRPAFVFVAIERATRFVHVEILNDRRADTVAAAFLRFLNAFGHPVHTVLTDNGGEFTDRFAQPHLPRRTGTGAHPFDRLCKARHIAHRLTRPYHPRTNGMVERFNRRLADALAQQPSCGANAGKNHFASHAQRNAFIQHFVSRYNHTRLRCLEYHAPAEILANLTKHNTKAGATWFVT